MDEKGRSCPVIPPGSTIGILGGGQLGRMMVMEGRKLGYRFITLDPAPDCPAAPAADCHIVAAFDDWGAADRLGAEADLVTYEFENVDAVIVRRLEQRTCLPQGSRLLETTQHRIREKEALQRAGIPVTPFRVITGPEDLPSAVDELGTPCVLKTATGGYDGKGQQLIRSKEEIPEKWEALCCRGNAWILERFVPFEKELSVIAARSSRGETVTYPAVENVHRHHILHMTLAPAPVDFRVRAKAEQLARRVAERLGVVGLIAVEMFMLPNGELLVNELAPRPHNSGHFTYDASVTSQFEQHLRAVCGWPLGSVRLLTPAVMVNILGEHLSTLEQNWFLLPDSVKVHLYGKRESRRGRKMGHVTVLEPSLKEALDTIRRTGIWETDTILQKIKELEAEDDRTLHTS